MFDAAQPPHSILFVFYFKILDQSTKRSWTKSSCTSVWPKNDTKAWVRAIFVREVDVEIILSNPGARKLRRIPHATEKQIKERWSLIMLAFVSSGIRKVLHWKQTTKLDCIANLLSSMTFVLMSDLKISLSIWPCSLAEWGVVIDDKPKTTEIRHNLLEHSHL